MGGTPFFNSVQQTHNSLIKEEQLILSGKSYEINGRQEKEALL